MNKIDYIAVINLIDRWSNQMACAGGEATTANLSSNHTLHARHTNASNHLQYDRQHTVTTAAAQSRQRAATTTATAAAHYRQ